VTLGSRVPLWPVFSTRRIRRIQATTSCDDGLAGLSRLITPYLLQPASGTTSGKKNHPRHWCNYLFIPNVLLQVALEGRAAVGDGSVVTGADVEFVIVLHRETRHTCV